MEKQEMDEMKLEIKLWKENENEKHTIMDSWVLWVVIHYSCISSSSGYVSGFMSHVLCLYSCTVFWGSLFSVIDSTLVANNLVT